MAANQYEGTVYRPIPFTDSTQTETRIAPKLQVRQPGA